MFGNLPREYFSPLDKTDAPELDTSELCGPDGVSGERIREGEVHQQLDRQWCRLSLFFQGMGWDVPNLLLELFTSKPSILDCL
jgi:hypothetical protein